MNIGDAGVASDFNLLRSTIVHLRAGGLLVYPTETAYALGCDATNARAVREIFRLKGRERGKPLPLIVASRAMAERYARFTPLARKLAKQYWPGPLTIVLEVKREELRGKSWRNDRKFLLLTSYFLLPRGVVTPRGTLALRVPAHPIARALSRRLGRPIISTSANRSGQPSCYSVQSALRSLGVRQGAEERVTYFTGGRGQNMSRPGVGGGMPGVRRASGMRNLQQILTINIGPLPPRRPSTIVDAHGGHPIVLRRGSILME